MFRHETAIAEIFCCKLFYWLKLSWFAAFAWPNNSKEENEIRQRRSTASKLLNSSQQLVWEQESQTVHKILIEKNKIWAFLSFQCTLLEELPARTLQLFVVANNVGPANLAVSKKVLDYIVRIFPISKFCCEWLSTPKPDFFLLKIVAIYPALSDDFPLGFHLNFKVQSFSYNEAF